MLRFREAPYLPEQANVVPIDNPTAGTSSSGQVAGVYETHRSNLDMVDRVAPSRRSTGTEACPFRCH